MLTFNGDSVQNGYNTIESIIYDEASAKYKLFEIDFSQGFAQVQMNPSKCLSCHGESPKPLWESYPLWPGFYGSEDDCEFSGALANPGPCVADSKEVRLYNEFLNGNRHKGRYALLKPLAEDILTDIKGAQRPLLAISRTLALQNEIRIAQEIKKLPWSRQFTHTMLHLLSCTKTETCLSIFPPSVRSKFERYAQQRLTQLLQQETLATHLKTKRQLLLMDGKFQSERLTTAQRNNSPYENLGLSVESNGLQKYFQLLQKKESTLPMSYFVAFMDLMGQNVETWSMTPYPRYFSYEIGQFLTEDLLFAFTNTLLPQIKMEEPKDPYWEDHEDELTQKAGNEINFNLREFSARLEKLKIERQEVREVRLAEQALTFVCARCHLTGADLAPKMDFRNARTLFQDPALVQKALDRISSKDPNYRMPPNGSLSEPEIQILKKYIGSFHK